MGQERLGPSHFFIPLVLGPLNNSLVWYVPSLRYTRGLGWRMHCGAEVTESSTNKQHHPEQAYHPIVHLKITAEIVCVCVLLLQDLLQSCARGGRRRVEDMCCERLLLLRDCYCRSQYLVEIVVFVEFLGPRMRAGLRALALALAPASKRLGLSLHRLLG